ncbi:uncharacterized protein LOC107784298 isoform X2 [Nicotiana tabacum]|uniref:Uncharacterized protein LOC107784298 isoform X2 n=2 Tax=Nicotiana TaxID=4085 RepID=A0A1S3Z948_TOBAC|nr:PREDICTED: uncharacterized protein LOC104218997 [Nicotiana sylvestris]XP_016460894.1 PREDICTED: uncharacterized protein LOC107784298 isoform X2 [Nicotiana tabacum]
MAASANPAAGNNGGQEGTNNANGTTNNGVSVPDNSVIGPNQGELIHSRGLAVEWTPDEQSLLEELLAKYATDKPIHRYAKIAMQLKDKCVRDIALRCRWMSKKENGKRRKDDQVSRKNKDKKEKITDSMPKSTHVANRTNGPPYAQAVMSMDSDDGISYQAIGGPAGQLLEQNAQALDQISANFAIFKIQENINLFCQARNNILSILNDLNDAPEIMRQMPPLPVKLNDELANSMLQRPPLPK